MRALHNGIALRENFNKRGCASDQRYPMCGEEVESTIHMLVTCPESRWVCGASPLRTDTKIGLRWSFKDWRGSFVRLIHDDI